MKIENIITNVSGLCISYLIPDTMIQVSGKGQTIIRNIVRFKKMKIENIITNVSTPCISNLIPDT